MSKPLEMYFPCIKYRLLFFKKGNKNSISPPYKPAWRPLHQLSSDWLQQVRKGTGKSEPTPSYFIFCFILLLSQGLAVKPGFTTILLPQYCDYTAFTTPGFKVIASIIIVLVCDRVLRTL